MHDVFISFSFSDQSAVDKIAAHLLDRYNITYWMCTQETKAGERYKERIADAISEAKILVFIQSRNSVKSEEVPKEVSIALNRKKAVIPFVLDDSTLTGSLEYDLTDVLYIDASRPPLEDRIKELADEIHKLLESRMRFPFPPQKLFQAFKASYPRNI